MTSQRPTSPSPARREASAGIAGGAGQPAGEAAQGGEDAGRGADAEAGVGRRAVRAPGLLRAGRRRRSARRRRAASRCRPRRSRRPSRGGSCRRWRSARRRSRRPGSAPRAACAGRAPAPAARPASARSSASVPGAGSVARSTWRRTSKVSSSTQNGVPSPSGGVSSRWRSRGSRCRRERICARNSAWVGGGPSKTSTAPIAMWALSFSVGEEREPSVERRTVGQARMAPIAMCRLRLHLAART